MISNQNCYLKDNCKKYKNGTCANDFCIRLFNIDTLYNKAQLSEAQKLPIHLMLEYEDPDEQAFKELASIEANIVAFVNEGKNLFIRSNICGNGKTAWALKLLKAYINEVWPETIDCRAIFINVPRFLLALKASISESNNYISEIKNEIFSADLIVWDEIGIKNLTEYEHEQLLNYINTRIDLGKSNIYTSNLDPDALKVSIGERLYSRVVNMSNEIIFYGQDKRGLI